MNKEKIIQDAEKNHRGWSERIGLQDDEVKGGCMNCQHCIESGSDIFGVSYDCANKNLRSRDQIEFMYNNKHECPDFLECEFEAILPEAYRIIYS